MVYNEVNTYRMRNSSLAVVDEALAQKQAQLIISSLASQLSAYHLTELEAQAFIQAIKATLMATSDAAKSTHAYALDHSALLKTFYLSLKSGLLNAIFTAFDVQLPATKAKVTVVRVSGINKSHSKEIQDLLKEHGILSESESAHWQQRVPYGFMSTKGIFQSASNSRVHVFIFEPIELPN